MRVSEIHWPKHNAEAFLRSALDKFGGKVPRDLISYAALCGILKGVDDPYTVYMTPREYSNLMEQIMPRRNALTAVTAVPSVPMVLSFPRIESLRHFSLRRRTIQ